jgi:hypothetical protein
MKYLTIIFILIFGFSVFGQNITVSTKPQTKPILMPKIESIQEESVWRLSKNEDKYGSNLPPWTEVLVLPYFKTKPVLPSKVTVVPLDVDFDSFNWQIAKSERKESGCDETKPYAWEVTLQLTQKEFFEFVGTPTRGGEFPFDVVVLYPAVEYARQLKKKQLKKQMLPQGTSINVIKAAIDVTNDQKPDILLLEFCCDNATKTTECEYQCGKTFTKVNGKWKLINASSPC